jgi:hypothetical protein
MPSHNQLLSGKSWKILTLLQYEKGYGQSQKLKRRLQNGRC